MEYKPLHSSVYALLEVLVCKCIYVFYVVSF